MSVAFLFATPRGYAARTSALWYLQGLLRTQNPRRREAAALFATHDAYLRLLTRTHARPKRTGSRTVGANESTPRPPGQGRAIYECAAAANRRRP